MLDHERLSVNYQTTMGKYGKFEKEQSVEADCSFSFANVVGGTVTFEINIDS